MANEIDEHGVSCRHGVTDVKPLPKMFNLHLIMKKQCRFQNRGIAVKKPVCPLKRLRPWQQNINTM